MITRYKDEKVAETWCEIRKISYWLNIEKQYLLKRFYDDINIVKKIYEDFSKINIDLNSINEISLIEKEIQHDFLSFIQWLEPKLDKSYGNFLHFGLTSSDIIDTTIVLQCRKTLEIIISKLKDTKKVLSNLIDDKEISSIEILARTHGQAAEKQTVGDILVRWLFQANRCYNDIYDTQLKLRTGKLSGPVGNNTYVDKELEEKTLNSLFLSSQQGSSQIISRDIFLDFFYCLLKVALFIEKVSFDIRLYSQSEIGEICEGFSEGQKGSSSMPHKKNPILCENLFGLARLYKGYMQVAIDNCLTQHERDISHSSSERIIFEDCSHIISFGVSRLTSVLSNLYFNKERCTDNLNKNKEKLLSQYIMIENIKSGLSRKEAYEIAQEETCLK